MKKYLAILIALTMAFLSTGVFSVFAADKVVFSDQDFTLLRSKLLSAQGGAEAAGAYEENHFKFWGGDGLLANGDGYYVGYITYKISAPANQKISTLTLDLVGRIGTYDGTDPETGEAVTAQEWISNNRFWIRIYVFKDSYAFDREKWEDYEDKVAVIPTLTPNPASTAEEYSFDLSQWAKDGRDVYITLATYAECTPNWIGFSHLTLSGTTAAAGTTSAAPTVTKAPSGSQASSSPASSAAGASSNGVSDEISGEESAAASETLSATDSAAGESSEAASDADSTGSAAGDESEAQSDTSPDKGTGILWWILPAVVIVAGAAAAFFLIRRKKKA